jgi:hypothetical protein
MVLFHLSNKNFLRFPEVLTKRTVLKHLGGFLKCTPKTKVQHENLVGGIPTALKNMTSSVGMIISFPILMESHKIHVPNHQPVMGM